MLHRLVIICITGFWLAMTGLLVVRELYPEATRLNAVPVGYVGQIMFQHEQASDLRIFTSGNDTGFLHIQPRNILASGKRNIELNGSITLALPGGTPQRLAWAAVFEMGHDFSQERLRVDISTPEPGQHVDVRIDFARKQASFAAKVGDQLLNETAFTLDASGFGMLLARAGLDPVMLRQITAFQGEIPRMEFGAQSSSTVISGQKLSTFLLSLKAGGECVFEAQMSQLGQVLTAQVPMLGWKFKSSDLTR